MSAVLAIDQGTTSTRGFVTAPGGRLVPVFSRRHKQIHPRSGWVEHDPEELVADLRACLDAAAAHDIVAVGLDNQGESCLGWDGATGEAVSPVIVWQDDRTLPETERLKGAGIESLTLSRAGLPLDPYFSASKLAWVLRHVPNASSLARRGRLRLGTTDAYFRDRLTGRFETDVTTASRTSLMNLRTCEWDGELCAAFGVPPECLPQITPCTGDLGGLKIGANHVPLTASLVDQQAATYGHGCRLPGDAKITFGTGAFAFAIIGAELPGELHGCLPTVAWARAGEAPVYALDGGVYAAGSAVDWAGRLDLFDSLQDLEEFDVEPAIARGLAFVPALVGLACPHWNRQARGAWLGINLGTTKCDLMQAVLEGIAFRMAEVIEAMSAVVPISAPISIDGGLSANARFCSTLADALHRPLRISVDTELTALGTAMHAAEAAGLQINIERKTRLVASGGNFHPMRQKFKAALAAVEEYGRS
ncbi:MAG: glycerol kinase [Rhizobiales bacterium]|nr:glycerol kinase [Hyphomicrobiales bacterium]